MVTAAESVEPKQLDRRQNTTMSTHPTAVDTVFVPETLPSEMVLTRRGWLYFDEWGREKRVNPQPERPANEGTMSVRKMCSYFALRKKFLYLPKEIVKSDKAKKKEQAEQKIHRQVFFLPHKEKRKILIKTEMDRLEAKKSKKQKDAERATALAFAREFGCMIQGQEGAAEEEEGRGEEETEYVSEIPGPSTDESGSEDGERTLQEEDVSKFNRCRGC
jgi:hypothetical protein